MNDIIYKHFLNKKNKYWEDYGKKFIKSELSKFNAITIPYKSEVEIPNKDVFYIIQILY